MKTILLLCLMGIGIMITQVSNAQTPFIKGQVVDAKTNESLPSVTVLVKGTTQAVMTDDLGMYSIKAVEGQVLVFSFIGYKPQEKVVSTSTNINVQLESAVLELQEYVIVAEFGIKRPARAVGAATQTVKGTD